MSIDKRLVTAIESIAETSRQVRENDHQLTQMLAASEQQQDRQQFRDAMMRLSVIAERSRKAAWPADALTAGQPE